jgi:excinuclease UvrABC nuclease subunit
MSELQKMIIDLAKLKETAKKLEGNTPGIYFLFDNDELVYIGKGWNCFLRVAEHTRKDSTKIFTSWEYIQIDDEAKYGELEKQLIKQYRPRYNRVHIGV